MLQQTGLQAAESARTSSPISSAPSPWVAGGKGAVLHWAAVPCDWGEMRVAASKRGVCSLSFNTGEAWLAARFPQAKLTQAKLTQDGARFETLLTDVVAAVEDPGAGFDHIPLDVEGTAFQEAVWRSLCVIPPGETRSYAQIAAAIGQPSAARAVGGANGANPVAVLIPCHRVVRADGELGGYAYGLAIKRHLLEREGALLGDLSGDLSCRDELATAKQLF